MYETQFIYILIDSAYLTRSLVYPIGEANSICMQWASFSVDEIRLVFALHHRRHRCLPLLEILCNVQLIDIYKLHMD